MRAPEHRRGEVGVDLRADAVDRGRDGPQLVAEHRDRARSARRSRDRAAARTPRAGAASTPSSIGHRPEPVRRRPTARPDRRACRAAAPGAMPVPREAVGVVARPAQGVDVLADRAWARPRAGRRARRPRHPASRCRPSIAYRMRCTGLASPATSRGVKPVSNSSRSRSSRSRERRAQGRVAGLRRQRRRERRASRPAARTCAAATPGPMSASGSGGRESRRLRGVGLVRGELGDVLDRRSGGRGRKCRSLGQAYAARVAAVEVLR